MTLLPKSCACTVVVAVYNGAEYLSQSLKTIANQDAIPRQVIIVDDGSTDESASIIRSFQKAHSDKFEILSLTQMNQGQSSARNLALSHVKHEFVAFLDQDDLWDEDHLDTLISGGYFEPQTGWVYSDFDLIDKTGELLVTNKLRATGYSPPEQNLESMLSKDLMMLPTASIVRLQALNAVKGFDTQFRGYEDDDLFIRMFVNGFSFTFVDRSTIRYRVHETNSSGGISFAQSRMKFFYKYLDYLGKMSDKGQIISRDFLAPRITSGILHDLFLAIREKNHSGEDYALENLNRLFLFRGLTFKRRVILLVTKIKPLYSIVYRANLKRVTYLETKKSRQKSRDTN